MSSSQRFCLRWNNHQSNLLSVFEQLLQDESFVDVTLAVEGLYLKAHKMVLSACSPYFQTLFVNNPDKHPIVFLKDVPYSDMRSLLDFMYKGEVSVDQERLTAFLKVAESLRIKGLTEVNEEKCDLPSITSSLLSSVGSSGDESRHPGPLHLMGHKRQSSSPSPLHHLHHSSMATYPPKRKRGRPQKEGGVILQGPPELLETRVDPPHMSKDRHLSPHRASPAHHLERSTASRSPDDLHKDLGVRKIKEEHEPTPGPSSHDPTQGYSRTSNSQDSDGGGAGSGSSIAGGSYNTAEDGEEATTTQHLDSYEEYYLNDQGNDSTNNQETDSRLSYFDIKQKCIQESELSFRCITCQRTYSNFGNFQRHYATAHMPGKRTFPCPMCQREFTRKDNMQAHVRYTHGDLS